MTFTVLGDAGFIGSHLVRHLRSRGLACRTLPRDYRDHLGEDLGHVLYCVGVTSDFRSRPLDTVEAHVSHPLPLLRAGRFESFVYLSSTRLYVPLGTAGPLIGADPTNPDHLYNISKAMGESACLTLHPTKARVVRLSNVYGDEFDSPNFLGSIVRGSLAGRVELATSLDTERDYVSVEDVTEMILAIATQGRRPVYDIGFGANRTTREVLEVLRRETDCAVQVTRDAPTIRFPTLDVSALRDDFGYKPRDVLEALPDLIKTARRQMEAC